LAGPFKFFGLNPVQVFSFQKKGLFPFKRGLFKRLHPCLKKRKGLLPELCSGVTRTPSKKEKGPSLFFVRVFEKGQGPSLRIFKIREGFYQSGAQAQKKEKARTLPNKKGLYLNKVRIFKKGCTFLFLKGKKFCNFLKNYCCRKKRKHLE